MHVFFEVVKFKGQRGYYRDLMKSQGPAKENIFLINIKSIDQIVLRAYEKVAFLSKTLMKPL